ncbi:MAG: M4 family metallopeptidase, partial [Ferruginibacter sp.]
SFTADLVYESESGAMNEALSDIWAASIERYVLVNIDPTLSSVFKPFSIGEQISLNPASPLRRMDNPKAKTDPDTYGGQYWVNPVCTPTLANDQCGVHTNSGILNKWYYLLTVGSLTGSGPDVSYAIPGSDDGLRDNGVLYNSVPYAVNGIGFNKAEAITYLMELMLTPTATFAQARTAAINAARILYGECSAEEISVTNAWNAIGVGAAYTTCALPVISASALQTDVRETAGGLACDRYNEYNINVNLTAAQPTPTTVNVSVGATTMSPDEYALSASSVTYNIGETGLRTVKLRIYDDAMVELDETIDIVVTSASPSYTETFTYTVRNDDVVPVIGGTLTLLNENFEGMAEGPFAAPTPGTWGFIDKLTPDNIQWAVRTDGTVPSPIIFTTKRAIIEITAPVAIPGEALYDQVAEANTILRAPLINATGLNSVKVAFKYQAGGEPACSPACDYARLLYSYDGINFSAFFDMQPLFLTPTESSFEYTLPGSFNGKQFYLGIQWYNDANGGVSGSVAIDSFVVTANGKAIESELADSVSEKVNAETGKPSYFYSIADGELIARISNSTAHNYACVSTELEKAGTSGFELYVQGTAHHRVADKVIRANAAVNNASGSFNITLYLTEAEIVALEAYTGFTRTQFYIYKTSANPYTGANAGNTERTLATYTALAGVGGSFSASFSTGISAAFAIGIDVAIPLPLNCMDFKAVKKDNSVQLVWKVAQEINNSRFEIEQSTDGINYMVIGTVAANAANNGNYSFTDINLYGKRVYYRLKQIDRTGESKYICSMLSVPLDNGTDFSISKVYPNPSAGEAFVNMYTSVSRRVSMEYVNTLGQVFTAHSIDLQPGSTRVSLKLQVGSGNFIVRFRDEQGNLLGFQKFSRN